MVNQLQINMIYSERDLMLTEKEGSSIPLVRGLVNIMVWPIIFAFSYEVLFTLLYRNKNVF